MSAERNSDSRAATPHKTTEEVNKQSSSLFSELLESGEEIEGMFQQRRKQEMLQAQNKKINKKSGPNGIKDPTQVLKERVAIYNKKRDEAYHLHANEEDLTFSGQLMFQYHNGYQVLSDDIEVRNSDTAAGLIPILLSHFLPQYESSMSQSETSNTYIALTQGGTERELDRAEKPLEIALDCSVKGLSFPSFTLKTSLSLVLQSQNNAKKPSSSCSLAASSQSSLGHASSEGSESPRLIENTPKLTNDDHDSLYSFSSGGSAPNYNFFTHPPSRNLGLPRSLFKSRSQTSTKSPSHHKMLEQSHSRTSDTSLGSPSTLSPVITTPPENLTPELLRKGGRSKSKVGNFMEGVARSLKSKRKPRPAYIYPEEERSIDLSNPQKSPLVSPTLGDRRFSMPAVFHVHYSRAKNTQLYKSVLVSEHSSTLEVIKQALERYGMKFVDPREFSLFEVIGRWEAVVTDVEAALEKSLGAVITPSSIDDPLDGKKRLLKSAPAFEEFVVHYTREMIHEEQPYNVQFFHQVPEGYTRRFELRSKESDETDGTVEKEEMLAPTTPIFGVTSHDKTKSRLNTSCENVTFSFSSPTHTKSTTEEVESKNSTSVPSFSFMDCSSPDSEKELQKGVSIPANYSSTTSDQSKAISQEKEALYPAMPIHNAFLLNLQLTHNDRDFMIYQLTHKKLLITASGDQDKSKTSTDQDCHQMDLHMPGEDGLALCDIHVDDKISSHHKYLIEPHSSKVSVNGIKIDASMELCHGDLLQLGNTHLFIFQDFEQKPTDVDCTWPYRWYPTKTSGISTPVHKPIGEVRDVSSHKPISSETLLVDLASYHNTEQPSSPAKVVYVSPTRDDQLDGISRKPLPTVEEVDFNEEETVEEKHLIPAPSHRIRSYSDSRTRRHLSSAPSSSPTSSSFFLKQQHRHANNLEAFPADRKLMFSYTSAEEDTLLDLLISQLQPTNISFKLGPAYVLAMCIEYNMRCNGRESAGCLACKAVTCIQQVIWKLTSKTMQWQPDTTQNTDPLLKDIYPVFQSVMFWFANCLEIYNFLLTQDSLNLVMAVPGEETEEESALTLLENMIQQLFQQIFYPVSKALYWVLPSMFEEALHNEINDHSSVRLAVECLKEVLELMLELQVHTEMIAHLFSNIFFFLNGALLNTFIDQGMDLGLFIYSIGSKLRTSLDILEGWAGRVGFREVSLQFLASFSSAIDLVAIPPQELTQLPWKTLREEFPCLHPAQLHFILSQYILPEEIEGSSLIHWTPSPNDSQDALNKNMLHESFESNPDFHFPIGGYHLDLCNQPSEGHLLQEFVDLLRKQLKKAQKSIDVAKITEDFTSATQPILITTTSSNNPISPLKKPHFDVSEIVRESPDFTKVSHNLKSKVKGPHYSHKAIKRNKIKSRSKSELRGRVQSIVEPRYIAAPEKLMIHVEEDEEELNGGSSSMEEEDIERWLHDNFPVGSRVISLQRGNHGFGLTFEEKKDNTGSVGLFVKTSSESLVDQMSDLKPGDQILAIDDMFLVDKDEFSIIHKYIKEAEEEITLILAPRS